MGIWIQHFFRIADPDADPDPDPGFWLNKNWKKCYSWKKIYILWSIAIYLSF